MNRNVKLITAPKIPERKEMKLSDAFLSPVDEPALELKVVQLNVGVGYNQQIMEKCPLLSQYARYVGKVQQYASDMPLHAAVECAVNECIQEGILSDFLQKNRAEAIEVSIFEYDEEKDLENVTLICEAAAKYAPEYDSNMVYEDLKNR